jgi:hypothetical protein
MISFWLYFSTEHKLSKRWFSCVPPYGSLPRFFPFPSLICTKTSHGGGGGGGATEQQAGTALSHLCSFDDGMIQIRSQFWCSLTTPDKT